MVFFSSRRRHTRYWRDWSSDVCSSDLDDLHDTGVEQPLHALPDGGLRQPDRRGDARVGTAAVLLQLLDDRPRDVVQPDLPTDGHWSPPASVTTDPAVSGPPLSTTTPPPSPPPPRGTPAPRVSS